MVMAMAMAMATGVDCVGRHKREATFAFGFTFRSFNSVRPIRTAVGHCLVDAFVRRNWLDARSHTRPCRELETLGVGFRHRDVYEQCQLFARKFLGQRFRNLAFGNIEHQRRRCPAQAQRLNRRHGAALRQTHGEQQLRAPSESDGRCWRRSRSLHTSKRGPM